MPWYEPAATPPEPPCYHDHTSNRSDRTSMNDAFDDGGRQHTQQRGSRGGSSGDDFAVWGGDELQRRLEAIISPMLSSAELAAEQQSAEAAAALFFGSASAQYGGYQPAYPHPSFRHRERQPSASVQNSELSHFFYPHAVLGGERFLSPMEGGSASAAPTLPTEGNPTRKDTKGDSSGNVHSGDGSNDVHGAYGKEGGNHDTALVANCRLDERTDPWRDHNQCDNVDVSNLYENSRYDAASHRSKKGPSKQMTLAQDPSSGNVFCTPRSEQTITGEGDQSWADVGKIGKYHGQQHEGDSQRCSKSKEVEKAEKRKDKRKKKKKKSRKGRSVEPTEQQDILAALSGTASERGASESPAQSDNDSDGDFEMKRKGKTKKKAKKRPRDSKKPREPLLPDLMSDKKVINEASFEGIEECGFMNVGTYDESLEVFLREVKTRRCVAWTMVFLDEACTTPFLPTSKKYCTEKGPRCTMWNCTCDRQIRAMQASAPVLGAMFTISRKAQDDEDDAADGSRFDCYILPLGPTETTNVLSTSVIESGFERMTPWPLCPFQCDTSLRQRWNAFRSILMDKSINCITFNAAAQLMPYHFQCGINDASHAQLDLIIPGVWDLRLASWVLLPHSKDDDLEFERMREGFPHLIEKLPRYGKPDTVSKQLQGLITARENLELLLELHPIIDQRISEKGIRAAFDDIEGPLQSILSAMECTGIGFRPSRLLGIQQQLERKIDRLTDEARSISKDSTFLLSSPQQVAHLLFDIMRIEVPKGLSTKQVAGSQHRSTSEEALKAIQADAKKKGNPYPIIDILLEFRTLNKMLTTYIRPLPNFAREPPFSATVSKKDRRKKTKRSKTRAIVKEEIQRIHPMWMQTAVRTGRLSCRKPNMQQIPTDSVLGVNPRDSFTASAPGNCLFACDYSQNEIRILAHMSDDKSLISMFHSKDEIDIYKQMASACSGKPVQNVTDEERRIYKQVTLAVLYGMGVPQVAKKLSVSRPTAQNFFNSFFGRFQGVRRWIEATKDFARRHHYVTTISGRRRYLDDICSSDKGKRAQAERQAVNTIIQGSAADLMKLAMLKMSSRIMDWKKEGAECGGGSGVPPKILLQIHDELLFETAATASDVKRLRDAVMRCCAEECVLEFKIQVPLKLKCSCGISWGSMEEME